MNFITLQEGKVTHFGIISRDEPGSLICEMIDGHESCYIDADGYVVRTELEQPEDFQPFKYLWENGAFKRNPDFVPPPPSNAELYALVKKLKEEVDAAQLALAEMYEGGVQ